MSLEEDLKTFEKELSMLLVKFMKICDAVEAAAPQRPVEPKPSALAMARTKPSSDFSRAYA